MNGRSSCDLLWVFPYILLPLLFLIVLVLNLINLNEWGVGSRIILSVVFAIVVPITVIMIFHFVFYNILRSIPVYQTPCSI